MISLQRRVLHVVLLCQRLPSQELPVQLLAPLGVQALLPPVLREPRASLWLLVFLHLQ